MFNLFKFSNLSDIFDFGTNPGVFIKLIHKQIIDKIGKTTNSGFFI